MGEANLLLGMSSCSPCLEIGPSLMAMKNISSLCNNFLAFREDRRLPPHFSKLANDLLVPINEAKQRIRYAKFSAELLDQLLCSAKVVSWHPREEMVNCLELQAAVKEVQPLWAVDIHGGPEHLLWK